MQSPRHPAKFTDSLIYPMYELLESYGVHTVLDPFAGTGKIGLVTKYSHGGMIAYANELEREWLAPNKYFCDKLFYQDAETLDLGGEKVDAICTSPTYGNRMADHHQARDGSKRNTYTHCLGRTLTPGNTGVMQWGEEYRNKHLRIYRHLVRLLNPGGVFVLNIKNHIRRGEEIPVKDFHEKALQSVGLVKISEQMIPSRGNGFGANASLRTPGEYILLFEKSSTDDWML